MSILLELVAHFQGDFSFEKLNFFIRSLFTMPDISSRDDSLTLLLRQLNFMNNPFQPVRVENKLIVRRCNGIRCDLPFNPKIFVVEGTAYIDQPTCGTAVVRHNNCKLFFVNKYEGAEGGACSLCYNWQKNMKRSANVR